MKKHLYTLVIALIIFTLDAFGQSALVFPAPEWNFGSTAEEGGILYHNFVVRNTGEHPEVILDITATCGCLKPSFARKPIMPGEQTTIKVGFQPAGQRGVINRTLTVFGDRHQVIARLRVVGEVIPRARTIEERYPVEVGKGVRLTSNHLPFGTVAHGEMAPVELRICNTDTRPHRISLTPEVESGLLKIHLPEQLEAGEERSIAIGYALPAESRTYGTLRDTYYIEVDGERQTTRFATQAVAVDHFKAGEASPALEASSEVLRLGEVESGTTATCTFTLRNRGEAPLIIRAVELPEQLTSTLRAGEQIPAGQARSYTLRFTARDTEFGAWVKRLLVVTNDPKRPLWRPRASAIIIE